MNTLKYIGLLVIPDKLMIDVLQMLIKLKKT